MPSDLPIADLQAPRGRIDSVIDRPGATQGLCAGAFLLTDLADPGRTRPALSAILPPGMLRHAALRTRTGRQDASLAGIEAGPAPRDCRTARAALRALGIPEPAAWARQFDVPAGPAGAAIAGMG